MSQSKSSQDLGRRIRVAHVASQLDMGGMEKLLVEFAKHADRKRFELYFVSLTTRGELADEIEACGWPVIALDAIQGLRPKLIGQLRRLLVSWNIDLVHTHNRAPLIYGGLAARLAQTRAVIHTRHGRSLDDSKRQAVLFRYLSRLADQVICVSQDCTKLSARQGVPTHRLRRLWNGIDVDRFSYTGPRSDGPAVMVARLSPEKDAATLVQAAALVVRALPTFQLAIAGAGPCMPALKALISRLGLERAVRLLGEVRDIPGLLAGASLFVLPSLSEGISLTILEAMARGLPVVTTRVGGNPEIVLDGETGLLVPARSPEQLADAILQIHRCADREREMGLAGRRRVESHFNVRCMIRQYEAIYDKLAPSNRIHFLPALESTRSIPAQANGVCQMHQNLDSSPSGSRVRVFITVDTEVSSQNPNWKQSLVSSEIQRDIYGVTNRGSYGIPYQMDVLNAHGLKGVFFVESLFACAAGLDPLGKIVDLVHERGHEVQLHIHTEWLRRMEPSLLPGRSGQNIRDFSEDEQTELIARGLENLKRCGGRRVCAFRAGNYGANLDTLRALARNRLKFDSSHNSVYLKTDGAWGLPEVLNQPRQIEGIYEFPVSFFSDWPGHYRHAQLCACSLAEMENALLEAWKRKWYSFVIVSHGFEMIRNRKKWGKIHSPDWMVIKRFEGLCNFLAHNRDRFQTCFFADIDPPSIPVDGRAVPLRSSFRRTAWRMVEQTVRRLS